MTEFAILALPTITSSLTNPRKHFDAAKLAELASSIQASGVHQPILVRPLPGHRVADTERGVQYELVCGERRLRASIQAGVPTIPAMVRALTDDQVLEIQIVENLQRDDLTELEEAEGYTALMQHNNITADQVADKISKSRSTVYARLKLLDLSIECKQALREGKIDASRALLIARIPDSKLQLKALEYATEPGYAGDPVGVRDFQLWLKQNVMLRLEHATFLITDAHLLASAGSCKDCPKRTGANPDLFADVDGADICTDPACYQAKTDAHHAKLRAVAEKKGLRVVDGKEALAMCPAYKKVPEGYSTLGQVRNDISLMGATGHTLRALLGDDAPAPILFEHPRTKELLELVPTDEAEAVLLAKGYTGTSGENGAGGAGGEGGENKKQAHQTLQRELSNLQKNMEDATAAAINQNIQDAQRQAVRNTDETVAKALIGSTFLRAWLSSLTLHSALADDMAQALGYTFAPGADKTSALLAHIKSCSHADLCRAGVLYTATAEQQDTLYESAATRPLADYLSDALALPVMAITANARKRVKAECALKAKVIQAQIDELDAPKAPPPTAPLAQPEHAGGKAKGKDPKPPAAPAAKKAKLSAEDAQLGIATAMQGMERAATPPEAQQSEEVGIDVLFESAVELIAREGKATVRLLKSGLGIGTTKALELMASLESANKVSACDERGARTVLVGT
jgi:ParB/RepB/Spo0J family partition protein